MMESCVRKLLENHVWDMELGDEDLKNRIMPFCSLSRPG
jgi:hypothetical protein